MVEVGCAASAAHVDARHRATLNFRWFFRRQPVMTLRSLPTDEVFADYPASIDAAADRGRLEIDRFESRILQLANCLNLFECDDFQLDDDAMRAPLREAVPAISLEPAECDQPPAPESFDLGDAD
jgi:hypothetical protein